MFHLDPAYVGHVWPTFMWTITIVAAIGCCMGFYEFVWFMSVGYGFAVMCIGLFHLIFGFAAHTFTAASVVLSILFIRKRLSSNGTSKVLPLKVHSASNRSSPAATCFSRYGSSG